MKKLKIKLLLLQYENELKNGNREHINDFIASNVILILLKSNFIEYDFNEVSLNKLINRSIRDKKNKSCKYKIPSKNILNYLIKQNKKEIKNAGIRVGFNEEIAATIWLKLMLENNLIKENQIIDLNEYKLNDFINDTRLIKIAGISEFSNTNLHDFVIDREKQKVKINKHLK